MKVLVTGANGFTASHLCHALLAQGHEVHGIVRNPAKLNGLREEGLIPEVGDLTNRDFVDLAVRGMDMIYHLAAAYRESLPLAELRKTNVDGTQFLLDAAKRYKVSRFVHCSTVGVHGHIENPPADENAPFDPGDDYQRTKLEGEQRVQEWIRQGYPGVVYRPVGMYGPGDTRFLKLFRAIKNGTFIMFGKGRALYHLTYIDDHIQGVLACGTHPKALGQTYIVAGPPAVTLNELVQLIAEALQVRRPRIRLPFSALWGASIACEAVCGVVGIKPPLYRRRADWFRKDRSFSTDKIERELGVVSTVTLADGLRRTSEWYHQKGLI